MEVDASRPILLVNVATCANSDTIVSGSVSGEIKLWDLRTAKAVRTYTTTSIKDDVTTTVAVHQVRIELQLLLLFFFLNFLIKKKFDCSFGCV